MKDLSVFTDDELRKELNRRRYLKLKENKFKIEYITFTGVVKSIQNGAIKRLDGNYKYDAFYKWEFELGELVVIDGSCDNVLLKYNTRFKCHQKITKKNAPKIGDVVKLRVRKTKNFNYNSFKSAKIIEIIE